MAARPRETSLNDVWAEVQGNVTRALRSYDAEYAAHVEWLEGEAARKKKEIAR
jgi:hypothetical protein